MPRLNVTSVTASGNVEALKSFSAGTGFRLPQYTSGNRPASAPAVGVMIYRSDTDIIEVWDGSAWQSIVSDAEIQSYANDAGRPVSPEIGKLGFNLDTGALEVYNGIDATLNTPIWVQHGQKPVGSSQDNPAGSARKQHKRVYPLVQHGLLLEILHMQWNLMLVTNLVRVIMVGLNTIEFLRYKQY